METKTDSQTQKQKRLRVCVLASGSKGNAIYVSDGTASILIDAGLSGIEIERRMGAHHLCPESLTAILVSHEHADHVRGVGVLSRRYGLPVYMTKRTLAAAEPQVRKLHMACSMECGAPFKVGALTIHPFSTSHDADDPAGFTVGLNGTKIGIATDLGIATAMVKTHLSGCSLLVLESNHDPEMLMNGPYPWHLKQRIKGRKGHLSNFDTRDLLGSLLHDGLSHVVLAHLSEENNTPEKALAAVGPSLKDRNVQLVPALQSRCGDLIRL